ncbi:phosphatidylglycerol lysyltransferase domain-containing protein [Actinomadura syzygii]|uniref:phosphatidylglycerol lysyltransferase domain-containing protein n=1 Tax=Actinomadura syzygii TaxID=1427538 RepID=UPI001652B1CA
MTPGLEHGAEGPSFYRWDSGSLALLTHRRLLDDRARWAVGRRVDGEPVAFRRYVPCARGAAISLDAMRRRPDAPNGVHERMIADIVPWGRRHGVDEVSLNFATSRTLLDTADQPPRRPGCCGTSTASSACARITVCPSHGRESKLATHASD